MVTFQFLSTFSMLIPMVDCSKAFQYHSDMTELEREVCSQTAQIEDFVLQFLDRCFAVIEISSFEVTRQEMAPSDHRTNHEDSMKDIGMASTFNAILVQSSSEVYDAALHKMQSFIQGRILEPKIAGKITAGLCRCLCKARPERGLPVFLKPAINRVKELLREEVLMEESVDDELKFNLLLLSECVRVPGQHLLEYLPGIEDILDDALHMVSREGYTLACSLIRNILRAMTITNPMDYRTIAEGYDRPLNEHLPIHDWGRPGNAHNPCIAWHVPSEDELAATGRLLDRFLDRELQDLTAYVSGNLELQKDQLKARLHIISCIIYGCGSVLPFWDDSIAPLIKHYVSDVDSELFCLTTSSSDTKVIRFSDGRCARKAVVEVLFALQERLLQSDKEDDTKSLYAVASAYQAAVLFCGISREEHDNRSKSFRIVRRSLENRLVGPKRQIRALMVDKALLQHESRMLERCHIGFNGLHAKVRH